MNVRRTLSCLLLLAVLLSSGCRSMRNRERPPFRKITPAVAYELMRDNSDMLVLDLRAPDEFQGDTGHLRRAVNIPLDRLPYRMAEISAWREETLLIYCRRGSCEQEGMAILVSSGFENAILMEGGIDAWIEGGFKTELRGDVVGQTLRRGPTRPEEEEEKDKPATPPNQIPPPPPPLEPPPLDPPPP